jgi:hypothetical protein
LNLIIFSDMEFLPPQVADISKPTDVKTARSEDGVI